MRRVLPDARFVRLDKTHSIFDTFFRIQDIDEFHLDLFPYVAGEGTRLFDDDPKSYQLDLVSSTAWSNGTVGLHYRRHR